MGQRANYIIKQGDQLTIYYNHWRANLISSDLYIGEKRFLEFVNSCTPDKELIEEPWIEGCVIIDLSANHLYFWSFEFTKDTSVVAYYILELKKKWKGWKVEVLKNRMYDAEKILGIDYISKQELQEPRKLKKAEVLNDNIEEWETAVVIIKEPTGLFVTRTGNLDNENIISYGAGIIPLLKEKRHFELPKEEDEITNTCILIDLSKNRIIINESSFGLLEQSKNLWPGFELIMADFGYIEVLKLGEIDVSAIEMSPDKVIQRFHKSVKYADNFEPVKIAEKLIATAENIQFNPHFFENMKPRRTFLEKIKLRLNQRMGKKR